MRELLRLVKMFEGIVVKTSVENAVKISVECSQDTSGEILVTSHESLIF